MGNLNENKNSNKNLYNNYDKEIKNKLDNIKSKYHFDNIFSFIKDDNFKLKFFVYSKKYQKILNLTINNYKEKYFEQIGINSMNINDFFSCHEDFEYFSFKNGGYPGYYKKDYFEKKFEKYKNKFNNNDIKNYLIYYFEKNNKNSKFTNIYLDIYSPFFDILSKTNFFSDIFTIIISINFIKEYRLEKDYIKTFKKLNKLNSKYSILFRFININDIDYFQTFNFNLKNIEKLILFEDFGSNIDNYNYFFEKFFSFEEIKKNLIQLKIYLGTNKYKKIEAKLLKDINNFKSLEYLELDSICFKSVFLLI